MNVVDRAWLAGLLEGEGYFGLERNHNTARRYAVVRVSMVDEDVIRRAAGLMEAPSVLWSHPPSVRAKGYQPQYVTGVRGTQAASLLREILPFMGERRRAKILTVLSEMDVNSEIECAWEPCRERFMSKGKLKVYCSEACGQRARNAGRRRRHETFLEGVYR